MKLPSDESRISETAVERRTHSDICARTYLHSKPQRQSTPYPFEKESPRYPYSNSFRSRRPRSRIPIPSTPANLISYIVRQKRARTYRRHPNHHLDGSGDRISRQGSACICSSSRESVEFISEDQISVVASPKESETRVVFCSRVPNLPASPPLIQLYRRNRKSNRRKHSKEKRRLGLLDCYQDNHGAYSSDTDNCNSLEELQQSQFRHLRSHTRAKQSLGLVADSGGYIQGPHIVRNKHIHFYDRQHTHSPQVPSALEQDRNDASNNSPQNSPRAPEGLPPLPPLKRKPQLNDLSRFHSNNQGVSKPKASQEKILENYSSPRVAVGRNNFLSKGSSLRLLRSRGSPRTRTETPIPSPSESYQSLQNSPVFRTGHLCRSETRNVGGTSVNQPPNSAVFPSPRVHVPSNSHTDLQSFYKALSQCSSRSNLQQPQNSPLTSQNVACPLCAKLKGKCTVHQRAMTSRYLTDLEWRICHAVNIYVYKNGEEGQTPVLIHIPPGKKKNMKTVLSVIQERISYPIGYAKYLFRMNGKKIVNPCELEMYNNYVVASNYDKCFKPVCYDRKRSPLLVLNKDSKHVRELRLRNCGCEFSFAEKQRVIDDGRLARACSEEAMIIRCELQQQHQEASTETHQDVSPPPGSLMFVNGANAEQSAFKQNPGNIVEYNKQSGQISQVSIQKFQYSKQTEFTVAPAVISTVKTPNLISKSSDVQDIAAATSVGPGRYKGIFDDSDSLFYAKNARKKSSRQGVLDASGERKVFFEEPDVNNNPIVNTAPREEHHQNRSLRSSAPATDSNVLKSHSSRNLEEPSEQSSQGCHHCRKDGSTIRTWQDEQNQTAAVKQNSEETTFMRHPSKSALENAEPMLARQSISNSYTIITDSVNALPSASSNPRETKPAKAQIAVQVSNSADSPIQQPSQPYLQGMTNAVTNSQVTQNQQSSAESFLHQPQQYFIRSESNQDPRKSHQPAMFDTNSFYFYGPARPHLHMSNSVGYFPYQTNVGPKMFPGPGGASTANFRQPHPYLPDNQQYYQTYSAAPQIYQNVTTSSISGHLNPSNVGNNVYETGTSPATMRSYNGVMNPEKNEKSTGKRNVAIQMGQPSLLFSQFQPLSLHIANPQRSSLPQFPAPQMSFQPACTSNAFATNQYHQMNNPGPFVNQSLQNMQYTISSIPQALTHGKLVQYSNNYSHENNQNEQQWTVPQSPRHPVLPPPTGYRDSRVDPITFSEDKENCSSSSGLYSPSRSRKRRPQPGNYGSSTRS